MSVIKVNTIQNANGTTGITFAANGQMTLANTPLQLTGGQIRFPSTKIPSADGNTLDDYEEGTWTPSITASSGSITSYASRTGTYVKVGSLVMVSIEMVLSNKGTIGSAIRISGLPFTTSLNGFQGTGLAQAGWSGLSGTLTGGLYSSEIYLYNQASTSQTNLSGSNLTNSSEFGLSLTYRVA